jgi:hypothetical protein
MSVSVAALAAEAAPEDESDTEASILAAMHKADLPPEFSCAYRKTDLLDPAEDKSLWPPVSIKEWNTQITELPISPFTQQEVRGRIGVSAHRGARHEGGRARRVGGSAC